MSVAKEFKEFLVKDNALALAIGVIIGGAMGKFVGSITNDILMPVIGIFMPAGKTWETWGFDLVREGNTMKVGALLSATIDLLIIGLVCFVVVKTLVPKKADA